MQIIYVFAYKVIFRTHQSRLMRKKQTISEINNAEMNALILRMFILL